MKAIIGKKTAQKQVFLTDGTRIPVTVIDVVDNAVLDIKTVEKHGYQAVQLGYGKRKNAGKPLLGQIKKANILTAPLVIREIRVSADESLPALGDQISADSVFKQGDIVRVTGISKGKGFAGVVKRHNFRGGPRTHGQSDRERAPGSIGQTTTPGRVYRGKRMAGRMGNETVSILNLQIISIDATLGKKTILVKGLVPGSLNSIVVLEKTGELPEKKFVPLAQLAEEKPANTENTEKNNETQKLSEAVESSVSSKITKDEEGK